MKVQYNYNSDDRGRTCCRSEAEEDEVIVTCTEEQGYFVPVSGGVLDQGDEADVPGGAPVIIEDFFKDRFWRAPAQRQRAGRASEDTGVNFW